MASRIPLPDGFDSPFAVRDGLAAGIGKKRLLGKDLPRPFRGVRQQGPSSPHAYAPLLRPGDRFSHTTAARLWGLPLPPGEDDPIHVTATTPRNPPRTRGVTGHVTSRDAAVRREGLPVSHPATLFVELGAVLELDDLIAAGDALILDPYVMDPRDPRPWIGLNELREHVASSRSPGSRRARQALPLIRPGAESRAESLLRMLIVRAGLPEPELNPDLYDAQGRFLGRFDLVYRSAMVIVEYDGDQHRTSTAQYERDITRLERVREAGWTVIQVRAHGLFRTPAETADRVRRALRL